MAADVISYHDSQILRFEKELVELDIEIEKLKEEGMLLIEKYKKYKMPSFIELKRKLSDLSYIGEIKMERRSYVRIELHKARLEKERIEEIEKKIEELKTMGLREQLELQAELQAGPFIPKSVKGPWRTIINANKARKTANRAMAAMAAMAASNGAASMAASASNGAASMPKIKRKPPVAPRAASAAESEAQGGSYRRSRKRSNRRSYKRTHRRYRR